MGTYVYLFFNLMISRNFIQQNWKKKETSQAATCCKPKTLMKFFPEAHESFKTGLAT